MVERILAALRRAAAQPRVAWAVAVVALVAAVAFGWQAQTLRATEAARDEAREAAEVAAARVTTFEGAAMDDYVAGVRRRATDEYAQQVTQLFDRDLRAALRENEVESVGEVVRSFVQEMAGDTAEVFVIVRQSSVNAAREEPVEDELRMEVELARADGRWRVSDIAVLGPGGGLGPAAGLGETPQPSGDAPEAGQS